MSRGGSSAGGVARAPASGGRAKLLGILALAAALAPVRVAADPDAGGGWVGRPGPGARADDPLARARGLRSALAGTRGEDRERARARALAAYGEAAADVELDRAVRAEAAFRSGELLRAGGSPGRARAAFARAASLARGTALGARARLEIGHLHRRGTAHASALEAYLSVVADPRAGGYRDAALYWSGRVWSARASPVDARRFWRTAARAAGDPVDRIRAFDALGRQALAHDRPEEARRILAECLRSTRPAAEERTRRGERVRAALRRMRLRVVLESPPGSAGPRIGQGPAAPGRAGRIGRSSAASGRGRPPRPGGTVARAPRPPRAARPPRDRPDGRQPHRACQRARCVVGWRRMEVRMQYGTGSIELSVPARRSASVHRFDAADGEPDASVRRVERALEELGAAGFAAAVRGRRLGLLLADGTREPTQERFLSGVLAAAAGAREVVACVCTGTHEPGLPENRALRERLDAQLRLASVPTELFVHDADAASFRSFGTTRRGTPVEIDACVAGCDAFLALANAKFHYFAGYSNPVKHYVPGAAARETARANHSLALDERSAFGRHPWHPDPGRRDNPLAEDLVEAFAAFAGDRPHFALVCVGSAEALAWAGGGETAEVSGRAFRAVDRRTSLELEPARYLVVSPGGRPHDESLYTAQRALELTAAAVRAGGEVLFLARCPNGVGSAAARASFYEPLTCPLAEVLEREGGDYVLYSHKSVKLARYLRRIEALWLCSELADADVEAVHLRAARRPQAVLERWAARAGPGERVVFVDDASKLAVLPRRG